MLVTKNNYVFFSTKRKRSSASRIKKPSVEEQESASHSLKTTEVTVCAICWKEEDDEHNSQEIEWISCSKCKLWMHKACLDPNELECDEYECKRCY